MALKAMRRTLAGLMVGLGVLGGLSGLESRTAQANDLPAAASPLVTQLHDDQRIRELSTEARAFVDSIINRDRVPDHWQARNEAMDRFREAASEGERNRAVAALEEYFDAGGDDDAAQWLNLARLHRFDNGLSRPGMLAAWTAYSVANRDEVRAEALRMLGDGARDIAGSDLASKFYQAAHAYGDARSLNLLKSLDNERVYLTRVTGRIERDVPEICVSFTAPVVGDGSVRYGDYVAISPAEDAAARPDADALCLSGFTHGKTLEITLRSGLPLDGGVSLAQGRTLSVDIPDRSARVAFVGESYVLPARGGQGLPLETVNVERVAVEIYRLPARGLAAAMRNNDVFEDLAGWGASTLREDTGVLVWSGHMDTPYEPNHQQRSAVPFADAVPNPEPGLYAVTASIASQNSPSWRDRPTQWVLVTDIGVQTYHGARELVVAARSLETARPMPGAEVTLIARNNAVLGTTTTDDQGLARLSGGLLAAGGGARPSHVTVTSADGGDHAFLRLDRPALDLSDRGIGGRDAPGPLDAFLYLERGIYRPGETVELMTLLRDDGARAVSGVPLTVKVMRPDGVEVQRHVVTPDSGGGAYLAIPTADADRVGAWTVTAHAEPDGPAIGRVGFQLEDFAPARMEVLLEAPDDAILRPGGSVPVGVEARYLYGAPAGGLAGEAALILSHDPRPFGDTLQDYSFGLATESLHPRRQELEIADTDSNGRSAVNAALDDVPDTSLPMSARVRVTVLEPGGRATNRTVVLPVRQTETLVGLDPRFEGGVVDEGGAAEYRVLAVDAAGNPIPNRTLRLFHYAEDWDYQWYQDRDGWRYKAVVRDRRMDATDIVTGPDGTVTVSLPVPDWGRYRIEVADMTSGAVSSQRFRAGWRVPGPSAQDTPDTLRMTVEQDRYRVGETARLSLDPPFAGEALVTVLGHDMLDSMTVSVPDGGRVVEIPVTEAWGAGAYVTATLFRPGTDTARGPGRAVGVQWVAVDTTERTLDVTLETPETMRPRQALTIPVSVANAGPDTRVTVAVVDEGILQLTGFQTPQPDAFYLGKRALGVEIRDAYGALIDGRDATFGRLRSGGDAAGRHAPGLPDKTVKPLAFFSGPVELDDQGRATVSVDIPAFNGRVRVMAAAYDARGIGHGEAEVTVRDRMVTLVTLPRFLAPGDRAAMHVTLDNVEGPAGDWLIEVGTEGSVGVASNGSATLSVPTGGRASHVVTLKGDRLGGGRVNLSLTAPDGRETVQTWGLSTRPPTTRETRAVSLRLDPGQGATVPTEVLDGLAPETASLSVGLSSLPGLGLASLVRELDLYPYGCVEQTVSRALPLLVLSDVAAAVGAVPGDDVTVLNTRVDGAIKRVIARQRADGAFSLWGGGQRQDWLSAYATDFLLAARDTGHSVPAFALNRALDYLESLVVGLDFSDEAMPSRAYALYVLARAGTVDPGALRYVHDTYLNRMPAPLARAQLGAALAMIGDRARALEAFKAAVSPGLRLSSTADRDRPRDGDPYASELRDDAATVALMAEVGMGDPLARVQALADARFAKKHLSTQEQAWLMRAAAALGALQGPLSVEVAGAELRQTGVGRALVRPSLDQAAAGIDLDNRGDGIAYVTVTGDGIPTEVQPAIENGLVVSRAFYDLSGRRVDPMAINQSDILVGVISGEVVDPRVLGPDEIHHALVVDLLPAGLVLENASVGEGRSTTGMDWLPDLSTTQHTALRDDRFVASVEVDRGSPAFSLAYLARAVTPGVFTIPGVFTESMYQPDMRARGAGGQMIIAPR